MADGVLETQLDDVTLFARGKVRDVYDLGDTLLMVATDRVSAYDVVMPNGIPYKGRVLNQISAFWFDMLKEQKLAELTQQLTGRVGRVCSKPDEAWQAAHHLATSDDLICVTGSFFIAAEMRHYVIASTA